MRNICIVLAVWPWESEFGREVNLLFVEGSMWMSLVKRGLKMIADRRRIPAARRPPNENFARGIYYGGFPSGHLSQAGYAIALYRLAYNVDFLSSAVLICTLSCSLSLRFSTDFRSYFFFSIVDSHNYSDALGGHVKSTLFKSSSWWPSFRDNLRRCCNPGNSFWASCTQYVLPCALHHGFLAVKSLNSRSYQNLMSRCQCCTFLIYTVYQIGWSWLDRCHHALRINNLRQWRKVRKWGRGRLPFFTSTPNVNNIPQTAPSTNTNPRLTV